MQIEEARDGKILVMTVAGRVDMQSAPALQQRLLERAGGTDPTVLLDLSPLEYINSAGLRALLMAAKRIGERDGRFAVCGLRGTVREVFRISGFEGIFEVHADRQAALATLA